MNSVSGASELYPRQHPSDSRPETPASRDRVFSSADDPDVHGLKISERKIEAEPVVTAPKGRSLPPDLFNNVSPEGFCDVLNEAYPCYTSEELYPESVVRIREYIERFPPEMKPALAQMLTKENDLSARMLDEMHDLKVVTEVLAESFAKTMVQHCDLNPHIEFGSDKYLPHDTPLNLIWVGSLLPDRYLQNIQFLAAMPTKAGRQLMPAREVILWKDRSLLTKKQDDLMLGIPNLSQMEGLDVNVLDINDAGLQEVLEGQGEPFRNALHFARDELKNYAIVSDLLRYALLGKGSEAIACAEGKPQKRTARGMIYMDCDTVDTSRAETSMSWRMNPPTWSGCRCPLGFIMSDDMDRNDFLASNTARHPVALNALNRLVMRLNDPAIQKELKDRLADLKAARNDPLADQILLSELESRYLEPVVKSGAALFNSAILSLLGFDGTWLSKNSILHWLIGNLDIQDHNSASVLNRGSNGTWITDKPEVFFDANWVSSQPSH